MEKDIIKFLSAIEPLKSTLRHNWTRTGRQESSAEHTWRVAVFFLIIQDLYDLKIDVNKTLKMILIHDLPEITSGDIPGFIKEKQPALHHAQEKKSAKQLFSLLPPIGDQYLQLYQEYEAGATPEAKVAQALDKIETQLQHLESGPMYWSKEEVGKHMLTYPEKKLKRLNDIHISKIWNIIKKELTRLHKELEIS